MFNSDFEWAQWFKNEFGMYPFEIENHAEKSNAEWDEYVFSLTGYPNGKHPNAYRDVQIDWAKVAEAEDDGYEWPTMPWLPAPWERVGKTYRELNKLAYERRQQWAGL